jgi:hypothetical protein
MSSAADDQHWPEDEIPEAVSEAEIEPQQQPPEATESAEQVDEAELDQADIDLFQQGAQRPDRESADKRRKWLLPVMAIIILLALGLLVLTSGRAENTDQPGPEMITGPSKQQKKIKKIKPGGGQQPGQTSMAAIRTWLQSGSLPKGLANNERRLAQELNKRYPDSKFIVNRGSAKNSWSLRLANKQEVIIWPPKGAPGGPELIFIDWQK